MEVPAEPDPAVLGDGGGGQPKTCLDLVAGQESCSWNTEVIACGAEKDFALYRFAG
ncbi:hypothetical protein Q2K19_17620 [Micromonospora soli]|uniref:hypothetical protein n=1 Tax=Micromonospora sp. NBRC 110009 TaxID=3061627 RepID=UPI002672C464|nr:hypothetical protein [Micromonospora sp. NBRC 110009]WKT96059.1 hypothetical protein Q2K19_17620 [Micromonospora sp. NBRC 110009]